MIGGKRRGKTDGTCLHGLAHHGAHFFQLLRGRLCVVRARFAHDGGSNHRVARKHGGIQVGADAAQLRHVLGKGFKLPLHARQQGLQIHAFHHRQVFQHGFPERCWAGRNAKATVAQDRGGHAQGRRRRHRAVPGHLRIEVGVQVHNAGHQRQALGVHHFFGRFRDLADLGDSSLVNGHVGLHRRVAQSIVNLGAANDEVEHAGLQKISQSGRQTGARPRPIWRGLFSRWPQTRPVGESKDQRLGH